MGSTLWNWILGLAGILAFWILLEVLVRLYLEFPLKTGFYSSIPKVSRRDAKFAKSSSFYKALFAFFAPRREISSPLNTEKVQQHQAEVGLRALGGLGWIHLGWIADIDRETYRIERQVGDGWQMEAQARFGSCLLHQAGGTYRVLAITNDSKAEKLIGQVNVYSKQGTAPLLTPRIAGPWQPLFQPQKWGFYINDHTIFQDASSNWRLLGITSRTGGDYNAEKYLAMGLSWDFPPQEGMHEEQPVADFGDLAWAPFVLHHNQTWHLYWSPHKLHHATSSDGKNWENHHIDLPFPYHKFFRDAMILPVADSQWLLYATARGRYFSRIDLYQSFDLCNWQYIGPALRSGWGSERNAIYASMESPTVMELQGRYYLAMTYNNDSFFWPGILMLFKVWLNKASYNDTLVLHAENPYDFGCYRGLKQTFNLLTRLECHAPEFVYYPQQDAWFITTCGWPWVTTLTHGEVSVAPLAWEIKQG